MTRPKPRIIQIDNYACVLNTLDMSLRFLEALVQPESPEQPIRLSCKDAE